MEIQVCEIVDNIIIDKTGQSIAICWGSQKKKTALAKELVRRWNECPTFKQQRDDLLEASKYAHTLILRNIGQSTHAVALLEAAIAKCEA